MDRLFRLIMPSCGDMDLKSQEGGTINLVPTFFGSHSMGPHIHVVQGDKVVGKYRLRMHIDGSIDLQKEKT